MHNSSRALGRHIKGARVSHTLASQAPVAEPQAAPAHPASTGTGNRAATSPTERAHQRPSGEREPRQRSAGSRRAKARLTPLGLFLAQTGLDMLAVAIAFAVAYWLRFESDIFRKYVTPDQATYLTMLAVTVATIVLTFYFSKLYNLRRGASRVDEFYRIAGAVSMGTVLSLATNSIILGDRFIYSRQILLMGWVFAIVLVTLTRLFFSFVIGELHKHGFDRRRVLVVGTGPTAAMVVDRLEHHRTLGYHVVGVVQEKGPIHEPSPYLHKLPTLASLPQLPEAVRRHKVDEVILALSGASDRDLREITGLLQDERVSTKVYPDAFQLMTEYEVSVGELSGLPLLIVKDIALRGWNRILKRAFDIVFSSIVLIVTSPLILLLALAIKLTSPGPVFFIQERVGLDGVPFDLVKFRTMRLEGDNRERRANTGDPDWTVPDDPRRTHLGAFLRRFSLDELPQFYNVLVGEMSIVGPRPEQPHYVEEFAQAHTRYLERHREKAGITGWAQINGLRGDTSIELRLRADLYYVENWSLLFDLKIIVRTVLAMFKGKNAY